MKAQIISMDFILNFSVFMLALSVFFYGMDNTIRQEPTLDISAELMFERIDETYPEGDPENFFDGSRVYLDRLTIGTLATSEGEEYRNSLYESVFSDFNSPLFNRIDYCVFLASGILPPMFVGPEGPSMCINSPQPVCVDQATQAVLLTKPVLVDSSPVNTLDNLNVLVCGEER